PFSFPSFPYTTLFRSLPCLVGQRIVRTGASFKANGARYHTMNRFTIGYGLHRQGKDLCGGGIFLLAARGRPGREYNLVVERAIRDRKSTRLNSSHVSI